MPWKVFTSGDEYCVHKLGPDGSKGEKVACHSSRADAEDQKRALYASEKGFTPSDFKEVAVCSKPQLARLTIKEVGGQLRWIAHYSNNVRDNDNPPEILSAEGHRRFVYLVDKGFVPYPELWVWHQPEWRIGRADWLAVDEVHLEGSQKDYVFALASGYFFEEAKDIGYALADIHDVAMSHGMYGSSIERDPSDESILTGWITGELTVLPRWYAANKMTTYSVSTDKDDEEKDMTVKAEKIDALRKHWSGLGDDVISIMEAKGVSLASIAEQLDLETKDAGEEDGAVTTEGDDDVTKEEGEASEDEEGDEETVAKGSEEETAEEETEQKGVDIETVARTLVAINERLTSMEKTTTQIEDVAKAVKAVSERVDAMEEKAGQEPETPLASQLEKILAGSSAIGKDSTKVDGRTKLGKDAPEETKDEGQGKLFFMDFMNGS